MNPAVMRLVLLGSRGAWGRLAGVAAGVAVGTALLLLLVAAHGALQERGERTAWLYPDGTWPVPADASAPLSDEVALVAETHDYHRGESIVRRDVAVTADTTVEMPEVGAPPRPGEYYASPALARLIESVPADELGDRYGTFAGTLPDSMLASPDSLVVVVGRTEGTLRQAQWQPKTMEVGDFTGVPRGADPAYRTVITIGGIAVFLPLVLLVSIVTQLGAAERRERFATLRLLGASPRTVVGITASETAATCLLGALAGVVLYHLLRPAAAMVPVDGGVFFLSDLVVSPVATALVVVGVVAAATAAAAWRVHRAGIGPLGATRNLSERTPTAWRTVPLLLGLAVLGAAVGGVTPLGNSFVMLVFGFVLVAVGILAVGPWLTRLLASALLRHARSASAVIAAGRIRTAPVAAFRAVGGLVLAVFLVSVFGGGVSGVQQRFEPRDVPGVLPVAGLAVSVAPERFEPAVAEKTAEVAGVEHVSVAYLPPDQRLADDGRVVVPAGDATALGFPDGPDSPYVMFDRYGFTDPAAVTGAELLEAPVTAADDLRAVAMYVSTDGTPGALERARTALQLHGATPETVFNRSDSADRSVKRLASSLAVLAYLGMFTAMVIAGLSLAVATAVAVLDRRRVLGLLRLTGMPPAALRRVVTIEAALPLLAVLAPSIGLGLLTAWAVLATVPTTLSLTWPDPRYFVSLGAGLLLAVGAVAATFGTIRRGTEADTARYE